MPLFDRRGAMQPGLTRHGVLAEHLDPSIVQRGNILPLGRTAGGELEFAVPNMVVELARALMLPGDVAKGVPYAESDVTDMALETGMLASPFGAAVPRGAIGMNAWHGGPHKWAPEPGFPQGRPRLDKIGTGEGAAAYGWGFYAADAKDVAGTYRGKVNTMGSPAQTLANYAMSGQPKADAIAYLRSNRDLMKSMGNQASYEAHRDALKLVKSGDIGDAAGSLYKLDIPDADVAKFLDWDAPLSQQSEAVKAGLKELG